MEWITWSADQAKCCAIDTKSKDTNRDDKNEVQDEEGSLQQKEKEDLGALSLTDPPLEDTEADADNIADSMSIHDELRLTLRRSDLESL